MRVGDCAWSAQYHVELEADTISNWGAVPGYAAALEQSLGAGALDDMNSTATANMAEFANVSRGLYNNFMKIVRERA